MATCCARGRKLPRYWDPGLGNHPAPKSIFTTTPLVDRLIYIGRINVLEEHSDADGDDADTVWLGPTGMRLREAGCLACQHQTNNREKATSATPLHKVINGVGYYHYFASAAVVVDSSHMTASPFASWSRFSPPSNFVNGHVNNAVTTWALTCPETRSKIL